MASQGSGSGENAGGAMTSGAPTCVAASGPAGGATQSGPRGGLIQSRGADGPRCEPAEPPRARSRVPAYVCASSIASWGRHEEKKQLGVRMKF